MNRKPIKQILIICICVLTGLGAGIGCSAIAGSGNLSCLQPAAEKAAYADNSFEYWNDSAKARNFLKEYVQQAVNPDAAGHIPPENRIAVFDMDGTVISETNAHYLEYMMFIHRVLEDDSWQAPEEIKTFTREQMVPAVYNRNFNTEVSHQLYLYMKDVYAGMTADEFEQYVLDFLEQPVNGMKNMTYKESIYLPMTNVIQFLQDNGFMVYMVSGSDRLLTRAVASTLLNVPRNQIIGTDSSFVSSSQEGKDGEFFNMKADDSIVRGTASYGKTLKMNKAAAIQTEIGIQPVLAFGNTPGDESMLIYAMQNNPYSSQSFILVCDDDQRDHGDPRIAQAARDLTEKDNLIPISMKDDFKLIYPEKAQLTDIVQPEY